MRAFDIEIKNGGELWIGSRNCRYHGKADISLHGKETDYSKKKNDGKLEAAHVGMKYLWARQKSGW